MAAVDRSALAFGDHLPPCDRRDDIAETRLRKNRDLIGTSTVDAAVSSIALRREALEPKRRQAAHDVELLRVLTVGVKENFP